MICRPVLFALISLLISSFCSAQPKPITITTGSISGVANSDGSVFIYKGIPYAAPPVNKLRWRPPHPASSWKGVRKADHFGASCMQGPNTEFGPWTKEFLYVSPASEDCLYLNIWTPKPQRDAKFPIIVFIHGGAFTGGSGDVPVYDGEPLARSGVAVVTFNYRLGAFGFLAHPELTAESPHHVSGNYGLLDQIAALQWVKRNIAAFGGDPSHVAVAGQSAGAMSVLDLLASPLTKSLFSAAIANSGIGGRGPSMKSLPEAEKEGAAFAVQKSAPSITALRALSAEQILAGDHPMNQFAPIIDGWVVPENPMTRTTQGSTDNDVPVIDGFIAGDSMMGPRGTVTPADYREGVHAHYKDLADDFLKLYPANTEDEMKRSNQQSGQDRLKVGLYLWASNRARTHNSPVYAYFFSRAIPWPSHPEFGAFHTGDIPYAFGTLKKLDRPWEPIDFQISKMMMNYWKNMAASGNPNGSAPEWRPVDGSRPVIMSLGETSEPIPTANEAKFAFWKRYFESTVSLNGPVF